MKKPNKLQIKLLSMIIEDVFLIEYLEKAGFKKEIQGLERLGYIKKYYDYKKLAHEVLDCEYGVDEFVYHMEWAYEAD